MSDNHPNTGSSKDSTSLQKVAQTAPTAKPITLPEGWHQHPKRLRPQHRYAPYDLPPHMDGTPPESSDQAIDPNAIPYGYPHPPGTNVSVNNNGNFYRPWKEELALSFGKSVGNFFAFPFRLVGGIFEGIINAGIGIVKMILFAVIAPTLLYTGIQMYEAGQAGEPATEAAAQVGKEAIGLVGAVLGGVWDGIFGDDPKPEPAPDSSAE